MDINAIRQDFPILKRQIHGKPLVYLDNAATSQKPQVVIDALVDYYQQHNANVHRGVHTLGDESTKLYQDARINIASFIGANDPNELIFVRNTTEAINLIAFSWALNELHEDDEILVTELEHHSNLVTWQRVCKQTGCRLVYLPIDGNGDLAVDYLENLAGKKTKLVALTHISNGLGSRLDILHLAKKIKTHSPAKILLDAAQSVPHQPLNVSKLDIDFLAFSGHKMCGPMGIGCLWVNKPILENLDPFLVGGGMIDHVTKHTTTWAPLPDKFDAGTPNVADAVGLSAAVDYLKKLGMVNIMEHEQQLTAHALDHLSQLENQGIINLYGPRNPAKRAAILTFNVVGVHAHDTAQILDREFGIAIRSGHHCNQVLIDKLGVSATCRASFYLYNTKAEIDKLVEALEFVHKKFTNA